MNVFITGATGVLGKRVVRELHERGHDVVGLVRDDAGARTVRRRGGEPRRGDVLDRDALARAAPADAEVLVHAATAIPTARKPSSEAWERNERVRVEGAKNLVAVAGEAARRVVFPSIVWAVRNDDGSRVGPEDDYDLDAATRSAARTEQFLASDAADDVEHAIVRLGWLYAPDGGTTRTIARSLLSGEMPVVGGGLLGRRDAELSVIHADDAGRALAAAVETPIAGTYHAVDDRPVTLAAYLTHFADLLDAPDPSRVPAWLARLFVGKPTAAMLSSPFPTDAERFREATGWEPAYPTYRAGLAQVVDTWTEDGTLAALRAEEGPADTESAAAEGTA